jgi:hypothetical protein
VPTWGEACTFAPGNLGRIQLDRVRSVASPSLAAGVAPIRVAVMAMWSRPARQRPKLEVAEGIRLQLVSDPGTLRAAVLDERESREDGTLRLFPPAPGR